VFGNPYDEKRYLEAVRVSALEKDLEWLPAGSDTLLGEKGIQASGGQRARVSLARIVYCSPDIVLLDDPLSAVDVHVGKHIFKKCIKKALHDKTVVLVTHHLNYLREVDYVVFLKDGKITEQGTFDELMAADKECAHLVKSFAGSDQSEETAVSPTETTGGENEQKKCKVKMTLEEERLIGSVSPEVYREYIKASGGPIMLAFVVFLTIISQLARVGNDLWLTGWTTNYFPALTVAGYAGIYFSWGVMQGFTTSFLGGVLSFAFGAASRRFHHDAMQGVFRAPITFFDNTPLGRIVNRFSKDTDVMDAQLPMTMQMFLSIFSGLVATLALMCFGSVWLLIPLAPLLVVYFFMQQIYMRNSRELKRLESISRSPVFAHFSETMTGLSTIRAFCRQSQFVETCANLIDRNNQVTYIQYIVQRWLGLRLETLGAFICFFAALFSVLFRGSMDPSIVGLMLSYSLQITGSLNFAVRQAVEVEVNSNSIERLHHYAKKLDREAEPVVPDHRPPPDWPKEGRIDVEKLVIKYSPSSAAVLKGVSVEIGAREKVGVVGRTGAGKSTVTLALFRMLEPSEGKIVIDDLNITELGLRDLRSRLAIIPQDPILFSGTVRTNLDPFNQYTDKDIWDVLAGVNMKEAIAKLKEGLEAAVEPNGENFSTGQRQLLCLARAMLRRPRVLIMDEATANVDMASDQLIQMSLRRDFHDSTLITIAHRLNTVIDYDRILVLDQGEVVEFDSPDHLLSKPDGVFAQMVDNTGPVNSALLRKLAREKVQKGSVDVEEFLAIDAKAE
jgi:ABC-type multidrug transport system fused ATPase/permease subunit